ncbi:MAG: FAD-dependent oxidoreductase [Desulfamplus sp.]|nr:FAD-dependent oxidoreductase [Desulfamplus sp.]
MTSKRITQHPVLDIPEGKIVSFTWNGNGFEGREGEMVSSALFANGIQTFGHHHKDKSPQGIFCANGQCSQCLVIADGLPVKSCMTPLREGMKVESVEGLPKVPADDMVLIFGESSECEESRKSRENSQSGLDGTGQSNIKDVDVLIIGGGPAGLSAAIELGKLNIKTLLVDDKDRLGGKLVLQTHKFFGSVEDSHAGTRGFEIGHILEKKVAELPSVEIWLETTAVGVFSDKIVGVIKENSKDIQNAKSSQSAKGGQYIKIRPKKMLVATGAREKMLPFPGNTLPGVYGAGAFQTLVNRDLIKSSERVLIVGGGNVGIIAGYHAIQAGIEVVAVIEGLPEVGGYKVHADKLERLGVPIYTRHTVLSANGKDAVESVTIAKLDDKWKPIKGTEKSFKVDTVLIAVGLSPVNEFYFKAKEWGMDVYSAGDAQEIAEASAAMFTGKIEGIRIAKSLGIYDGDIPDEWIAKAAVLKSKPGVPLSNEALEALRSGNIENGDTEGVENQNNQGCNIRNSATENGVMPVFHCTQEIPCNPCTSVCEEGIIKTQDDKITGLPYLTNITKCKGCMNCVAICPGLAATLVDYRKDAQYPTVTLPYELWRDTVEKGQMVTITDVKGEIIGDYPVERVVANKKKFPGTLLVQVKMGKDVAKKAIGIKFQKSPIESLDVPDTSALPDEAVICRCERVTAGEIRSAIRSGVRDVNQLKGVNRTGMGSCGSKTCRTMVLAIFRDEGVDLKEVTERTDRPLFVEVPFGVLAGVVESRAVDGIKGEN